MDEAVYESNDGSWNEDVELDEDTNGSTKSMDEAVYESNGGSRNEDVELDEDTNGSTKLMDEELPQVKSLKSWFLKLINHDDDILDNSKLDVDGVLKKILDESQAGDKEFQKKQNFFMAGNDEWKVLDMVVLRYPDPDSDFFKLYRIQLTTWSTCKAKTILRPRFSTGITGEFTTITGFRQAPSKRYSKTRSPLAVILDHHMLSLIPQHVMVLMSVVMHSECCLKHGSVVLYFKFTKKFSRLR
ncbi:hypothetical protein KP509_15G034800 [Ceratopteris richardii]|uniref:Uncharacterized protein n=1 Tax=Ceratopteris richardii TaxID=49495 RepID=A0A8T2T2D7_CERRI|nr:hypothetical protein KP509_15G034800 [Ceratopteris richardii]